MLFGILTMFIALCISAVAIYYSVAGLVAIFAAAAIPIIIMGGVLEVGKLVTAVWLHRYWRQAAWWMRSYLSIAVVVLMFITSMGIFGFLSKAHIEQTSAAQEQVAQLERMDDEIVRYQDIITRAEQRITKAEQDAVNQDTGIQDKIDREQQRIDSAYTRRQPSIDEQQAIITAQENALANRVAVYEDEIRSLDTELERLNGLVEQYRTELANTSIAGIEEQIKPYNDQIAQLDADLERLNTQANEYEARISNVEVDTSAVDPVLEQIRATEESIVVTTNKLQSRESAKIREGQAVIGVTSDGVFGGNTRRALNTWVEAQQARIAQLQAQEVELRTRAQDTADKERARLTELVKDLRGAQTERVNERKQALLDTIDRIRNDAASGLDTQRANIQAKIDSVLKNDIPANRESRKAAQQTITELRNQEDPRIETARAEIARIRAVAEDEIANAQTVIERLRAQIQVGENVDLDTLIDEQNARIKEANNSIDDIIEQKFKLEAEARKLEAEVGPVKYIAEFIYGGEADRDLLEEAVRWVILTIIFVFDPLAVMLLIAAQYTFDWHRKPKEPTNEDPDPDPEEDPKETEETSEDQPQSDEPKVEDKPVESKPGIDEDGNIDDLETAMAPVKADNELEELLEKADPDVLEEVKQELEKEVDIKPYDPYNDTRADEELTAQELSERQNMKLYSPDGRLAGTGKTIKSIKIKKDTQ
jgi:hypothetical protein